MRTNHSKWTTGVLAACFAVALLGVGCGDDDMSDAGAAGTGTAGTGGTGGATAGTGGTTAGTGGAKAGTGGTGGAAAPTAAMCTTNAVAKMVDMACASCVCTMGLAAANACNADMSCWGLIGCIRDKCAGLVDPERTTCAVGMCGTFLGGAGTAMPVGMVLEGACKAMCVKTDTDGGGDAGI